MRLRPATPDDLSAVFSVMAARDRADLGRPDVTPQELSHRWNASEFGLAENALVAELRDGGVAAYAEANRHGGLIVVAPAHDADEHLGMALLSWTEQRERALAHERFHQLIAAGNERGRKLAERGGYALTRHLWRMVRPLDSSQDIPSAPLPPGVTTRLPAIERDATALHAIDEISFSADPDYVGISLTGFIEQHLRAHDADLTLSSVAERDGQLIGFLLCRRRDEERAGFIDLLAVHPAHQRHGLGRALLLAAFTRIAAAGLGEAQLTVSSANARGLALYESVGMTVRFQHDIWERDAANSDNTTG
ncbi:MAG TPA: GNAT family N-acetyltransferase [Solirubrobacteraceae bacterium]|nr:GNAT family N-acetyltransferase [Solirubrobacteraceae bacterium]